MVHAYMYVCACIHRCKHTLISPHLAGENTTISCFSLVVINVVFNITEYNVSESVETVMLHILANGTSSFGYIVTLMLTNINTGEWYY